MLNIQKMMQRAQQMQFRIQEMQAKLSDIDIEGESGGGLVKVVMRCSGEMRRVDIDPSLLSESEKETLEDLIVAATNSANAIKDARIKEETKKIMNELGLPEDASLPM